MSEKPEPTAHVIFAGVREAEHELGFTEWHIECRWSDGCKCASIVVDGEREELADEIAAWLNRRSRDRVLRRVGFDLSQTDDYDRAVLDRIGFDLAKLSAHERLEIMSAERRGVA